MSTKKADSKHAKLVWSDRKFDPTFDENSKILIVGTMPSKDSIKNEYYYSNPSNRFWPAITEVVKIKHPKVQEPKTRDEKVAFCLKYHIALWDVIQGCYIKGADDNTITDPKPNPLNEVILKSKVKKTGFVFCTGNASEKWYKKLCAKETGIKAVKLPSSSPANQRYWPTDKLIEEYKKQLADKI